MTEYNLRKNQIKCRSNQWDEELKCHMDNISQECITNKDFVKTPAEHCYKRRGLCNWLNRNRTDPITRKEIPIDWVTQECGNFLEDVDLKNRQQERNFGDDPLPSTAATTIQAAFRGLKGRKEAIGYKNKPLRAAEGRWRRAQERPPSEISTYSRKYFSLPEGHFEDLRRNERAYAAEMRKEEKMIKDLGLTKMEYKKEKDRISKRKLARIKALKEKKGPKNPLSLETLKEEELMWPIEPNVRGRHTSGEIQRSQDYWAEKRKKKFPDIEGGKRKTKKKRKSKRKTKKKMKSKRKTKKKRKSKRKESSKSKKR